MYVFTPHWPSPTLRKGWYKNGCGDDNPKNPMEGTCGQEGRFGHYEAKILTLMLFIFEALLSPGHASTSSDSAK